MAIRALVRRGVYPWDIAGQFGVHPRDRALRPGRATVRFTAEPGRQLQSDWATQRTVIAGETTAAHSVGNTSSVARRFHSWCTVTEDADSCHSKQPAGPTAETAGGKP
jgi:hypothetical protein